MPVAALLVALAWLAQASESSRASLIAESRPKASVENGVITLGASRGWLRNARSLRDFELSFEFRALTPDAEPGLIVRTYSDPEEWPGKGYRFSLPTKVPPDVASLFVARKQKITVHQVGAVALKPDGEWQRLVVTGKASRVRFVLNGTLVGEFELERLSGHVMFDNRKGRVELRNMEIVSTDLPVPPNILTWKEVEKAGGTPPRIAKETRAVYSLNAMRAKAQGKVELEVVVLADGRPGSIRLKKSLHPDLDANAVAAVERWRFSPAVLNGKPVSCLIEVELTFTLR